MSPAGLPARDPGLQAERTALAWQRSALSLAVATAVVTRLTFGALGLPALVVLVLGMTHCLTLFVASRRRYRRRAGLPAVHPVGTPRAPWPVGLHGVLLVAHVVALSALELADIAVVGVVK